MSVLTLLVLFTLLPLTSSKLLSSRSETTVDGWTRLDPVPLSSSHSFTLALQQRNTDRLAAMLQAVSDPTSPQYGQYLTPQQLQDLTAPPTSVTDPILHWLTDHGVLSSSIQYAPASGAIQVATTAEVVNALFGCVLHRWRHVDGREAEVAWGDCSMPDELASGVELVLGVYSFPPRIHHGPIRVNPRLETQAEVQHTSTTPHLRAHNPAHSRRDPLSHSLTAAMLLCCLLSSLPSRADARSLPLASTAARVSLSTRDHLTDGHVSYTLSLSEHSPTSIPPHPLTPFPPTHSCPLLTCAGAGWSTRSYPTGFVSA